jgi:CDP-2,3-bis-(O-geranylgeranyl)-sn-glycerol synthase
MEQILFALWFFLPAGVANMAPVFLAKLPFLREWSYPLDGYKSFRDNRILGDHKTVRGFLGGIICSIATVYLQQNVSSSIAFLPQYVSYDVINPVILGTLLGGGALGGDSVKSFVKRRMQIPSGKSWFPFDQLDYVIGGIILSFFAIQLPFVIYCIIVLTYFLLHIIVSYVGFLLGFKQAPI